MEVAQMLDNTGAKEVPIIGNIFHRPKLAVRLTSARLTWQDAYEVIKTVLAFSNSSEQGCQCHQYGSLVARGSLPCFCELSG